MTGRGGIRRLVALLAGACVAAVLVAAPAVAYFRIDYAHVPGIGRVGTTLPTDTKVHPPGHIPYAKPATRQELNHQNNREARLSQRVHPAADAGPPDEVATIKRQVAHELFLRAVAVTCRPIPKAALWVYAYIHAPPSRQPYLDALESSRRASHQSPDHGCDPARLRVDRWQGVRIDPAHPDRARAMLRGAYEVEEHGHWHGSDRSIWKLALRRDSQRWRIAIDYQQLVGDGD